MNIEIGVGVGQRKPLGYLDFTSLSVDKSDADVLTITPTLYGALGVDLAYTVTFSGGHSHLEDYGVGKHFDLACVGATAITNTAFNTTTVTGTVTAGNTTGTPITMSIVDNKTLERDRTITIHSPLFGAPKTVTIVDDNIPETTVGADTVRNIIDVTDPNNGIARGLTEITTAAAGTVNGTNLRLHIDWLDTNGGGILYFPDGTYPVAKPDELTYIMPVPMSATKAFSFIGQSKTGTIIQRTADPTSARASERIFRTPIDPTGLAADTLPMSWQNLTVDANLTPYLGRFPGSSTYHEQSASIFIYANNADAGKAVAKVENCHFENTPADAVFACLNCNVKVYESTMTDCYRGGVTTTGGDSIVEIVNVTMDGDIAPSGVQAEVDGVGQSGTMKIEYTMKNVNLMGGCFDWAAYHGSTFAADNCNVYAPTVGTGNVATFGVYGDGTGSFAWTGGDIYVGLNQNFAKFGAGTFTDVDFYFTNRISGLQGNNSLTNWYFSTDANWTKGTGWTIADGLASHAAGAASDLVTTSHTTIVGYKYFAVLNINSISGGTITPSIGGITGSAISTPGIHEVYLDATTTTAAFTLSASENAVIALEAVLLYKAQIAFNNCMFGHSFYPILTSKVTNGTFATDASWTKGTDWLIDAADSNKAEKTAGTASNLEQDITSVNAHCYLLSFVVTRTAGTVTPEIGGVEGTAIAAAGTYYQWITATGTGNLKFKADAAFIGSIDTVSVYDTLKDQTLLFDTCTFQEDVANPFDANLRKYILVTNQRLSNQEGHKYKFLDCTFDDSIDGIFSFGATIPYGGHLEIEGGIINVGCRLVGATQTYPFLMNGSDLLGNYTLTMKDVVYGTAPQRFGWLHAPATGNLHVITNVTIPDAATAYVGYSTSYATSTFAAAAGETVMRVISSTSATSPDDVTRVRGFKSADDSDYDTYSANGTLYKLTTMPDRWTAV